MKHYIYYDTNLVCSYLSQINDGVQTKSEVETTDQTVKTDEESKSGATFNADLKVGTNPNSLIAKIFNPINISIDTGTQSGTITKTQSLAHWRSGSELIEKMIHDNAIDHLLEYYKEKDLIKYKNFEINDFVQFTDNFDIISIPDIISLLNNDFIKNSMNTKIKINKKNNTIQIDQLISIFEAIELILPDNIFIFTENSVVVLNKQYMRESAKSIKFKYKSKITIIGLVTTFTNQTKPKISNRSPIYDSISELNIAVNKAASYIFIDAKKAIITPIALYFE